MAELALPTGGKSEFPRLQERLAEVEADLQTASAAVGSQASGVCDERASAALVAQDAAVAALADMVPRAEIFGKRARESDPDKRIYGPKMAQRVLDFCTALEAAVEHSQELQEALLPVRERLAGAEAARRAAAAAATAAAEEAQRAIAEAQTAAEARAEEEARQEAEEEAARRAAAIAAPLMGGVAAVAAGSREADELGRRPLTTGLDLGASLDLLATSCEPEEAAEAFQALQLLCVNVVSHPEDATFRTIRLLNAHFQRSVARHAGGVEALLAIGFVERESLESDEVALTLVMDEPSLEEDFDGWGCWFEGIKASRDALLERMQALGVRALPAAVKGTGWNEATPARPVEQSECLTLHGQRGGGI